MIQIVEQKISQEELHERCREYFGYFVKFVADLKREIIAIGGDLHADAEALLMEKGSQQSDLWGGNLYPGNPPSERIEFEALINIRPREDNYFMNVENENLKSEILRLVETLLLSPDETWQYEKE